MTEDDKERLCPRDGYVEAARIPPEAQMEVAIAARNDGRQRLGLREHSGDKNNARLLTLHVVYGAYTDATEPAAAK